jgi:hypothetical protein
MAKKRRDNRTVHPKAQTSTSSKEQREEDTNSLSKKAKQQASSIGPESTENAVHNTHSAIPVEAKSVQIVPESSSDPYLGQDRAIPLETLELAIVWMENQAHQLGQWERQMQIGVEELFRLCRNTSSPPFWLSYFRLHLGQIMPGFEIIHSIIADYQMRLYQCRRFLTICQRWEQLSRHLSRLLSQFRTP